MFSIGPIVQSFVTNWTFMAFFPSFTELTCLSIGPIVQSFGHKLNIYLAFFHHELNFKFSLYSKAVSFWIVTFKLTQNFLVDYISSFFLLDKISLISFVDYFSSFFLLDNFSLISLVDYFSSIFLAGLFHTNWTFIWLSFIMNGINVNWLWQN